ncbi:MAG: 23S rRNA (adenine(2030)-N(6))-methyltransferase RlmJ [Steroidobacteraceae bacterium]
MQYRHSFHAGNFADVHKHIALLALIASLQKKPKGFLFLDTHAGEGLYDLASHDARHSAESAAGIAQLESRLAPSSCHPAIRSYLDGIGRLRRAGGSHHLYPGSPLLAALALRDVDSLIAVESQAAVARALQRALDAAPAAAAARVIHGDGYQQLKALLPPPARRGLILIDPPYEDADEEQRIATGLAAALQRFSTGVYALWYPIKKRHDADLWLARITRGIPCPQLTIELCLRPPDNAAGLNGSGMLILNPPWQFDEEAGHWQPEVLALLGGTGGSAVRWLKS